MQNEKRARFSIGESITFNFEIKSNLIAELNNVQFAIHLVTSDGIHIAHMVDRDSKFKMPPFQGSTIISVKLEDIRLYPNIYYVSFWVGTMQGSETYDSKDDILNFEISDGGQLTTRNLPRNSGLIFLTPSWSLNSKK